MSASSLFSARDREPILAPMCDTPATKAVVRPTKAAVMPLTARSTSVSQARNSPTPEIVVTMMAAPVLAK